MPDGDTHAERVRSFGFERSPTHTHQGIDLPAVEGTRVYAAEGGTVEHATNAYKAGFSGYGKVITIRARDGTYQLYAHLKRPLVAAGDVVEAGDTIAEVGRTGYTKEDPDKLVGGAHLHFEVSPRAYPQGSEAARIDPVVWLRAGRVHPLKRKRFDGSAAPVPDEGAGTAERPLARAPAGEVSAVLHLRAVCPRCSSSLSLDVTGEMHERKS
jgi:murein DD-endopeptidase MepM/ murein hydrolase activator NlpD